MYASIHSIHCIQCIKQARVTSTETSLGRHQKQVVKTKLPRGRHKHTPLASVLSAIRALCDASTVNINISSTHQRPTWHARHAHPHDLQSVSSFLYLIGSNVLMLEQAPAKRKRNSSPPAPTGLKVVLPGTGKTAGSPEKNETDTKRQRISLKVKPAREEKGHVLDADIRGALATVMSQ